MTTLSQWAAGARPRTLPAAVVPVAVGVGVAVFDGSPLSTVSFAMRAALALIVSVSLQVGVNYANDYSDGVRGTDEVRVGPVRLVGQQLAEPRAVKFAAWLAFGVAGVAGLMLVVVTAAWWLLIVGAVAVAAAWGYTGGPRPYGYSGLGEVVVFVFFGVVAVAGTTFVCGSGLSGLAVVESVPVGLLACSLLIVNNLRDISTDIAADKRTLAVRVGDARTRRLYRTALLVSFGVIIVVGALGLVRPGAAPLGAWLALLSAPLAWSPLRLVMSGSTGTELIEALAATGRLQLIFGLLLAIGTGLSNLWVR